MCRLKDSEDLQIKMTSEANTENSFEIQILKVTAFMSAKEHVREKKCPGRRRENGKVKHRALNISVCLCPQCSQ